MEGAEGRPPLVKTKQNSGRVTHEWMPCQDGHVGSSGFSFKVKDLKSPRTDGTHEKQRRKADVKGSVSEGRPQLPEILQKPVFFAPSTGSPPP